MSCNNSCTETLRANKNCITLTPHRCKSSPLSIRQRSGVELLSHTLWIVWRHGSPGSLPQHAMGLSDGGATAKLCIGRIGSRLTNFVSKSQKPSGISAEDIAFLVFGEKRGGGSADCYTEGFGPLHIVGSIHDTLRKTRLDNATQICMKLGLGQTPIDNGDIQIDLRMCVEQTEQFVQEGPSRVTDIDPHFGMTDKHIFQE